MAPGQVWAYGLGVASLWIALDWPIDPLGDHYLFSIHMVQHLLISMVAAPLMLLGTPDWLLRMLLRPRPVYAVARRLTRPFVAFVKAGGDIQVTNWRTGADAYAVTRDSYGAFDLQADGKLVYESK